MRARVAPDEYWLDDQFNRLATFRQASPELEDQRILSVVREGYRIGVPQAGFYREAFNSDAGVYGGSNLGNQGGRHTDDQASHGQKQSLSLTLPPLATMIFLLEG